MAHPERTRDSVSDPDGTGPDGIQQGKVRRQAGEGPESQRLEERTEKEGDEAASKDHVSPTDTRPVIVRPRD